MAVILEIDKWKLHCVTKLVVFGIIYLTLVGIPPTNGFNLLEVRDLVMEKMNTTIEIAVVVPGYQLLKNECCPANESVCGRQGTQCQCHEDDVNCICVCPTDNFPIGFNFNLGDCCSVNNTYCRHFGDNCACEQDDSGCRCVCPSELDYTVKLAAGIALVLLIGVTIMLAVSLYRRAVLLRRQRRSSRGESITSEASGISIPDPPPCYAEAYSISIPKSDANAIDFEKLPSYEEALSLQAQTSSNIKSSEDATEEQNQIGIPSDLDDFSDEQTSL